MVHLVGKFISDDYKYQFNITRVNPENGIIDVTYKNELNSNFEARGHYGGTNNVVPPLSLHFYSFSRSTSGGNTSFTYDTWTGFCEIDGKLKLKGTRTIACSNNQTQFKDLGQVIFHPKLALRSDRPGLIEIPVNTKFTLKNSSESNTTHFKVTPGLIKQNGTPITSFTLERSDTITLEAGTTAGHARVNQGNIQTLYGTITVSSNGGLPSDEPTQGLS